MITPRAKPNARTMVRRLMMWSVIPALPFPVAAQRSERRSTIIANEIGGRSIPGKTPAAPAPSPAGEHRWYLRSAMGRLFETIRRLVEEEKYVVGQHAAERLEERSIMEWQVVAGLADGKLMVERPDAIPNP